MAQSKIIVDSNCYFRLAQNIHPLLSTPFGSQQFTLYIHADLAAEFKYSPRLRNKFHWLVETKYVDNRSRSIGLSNDQKAEVEIAYSYLTAHVQEEFLDKKGKGPSPIDTMIVAIALVLGIEVLTDDQDMIELSNYFEVKQLTSLMLMKRMLDCNHIDDKKVDQIVEQWIYENDTPYKNWRKEFGELFGRKAPKGNF